MMISNEKILYILIVTQTKEKNSNSTEIVFLPLFQQYLMYTVMYCTLILGVKISLTLNENNFLNIV